MKQRNLLKNMSATIVALFIVMFALPQKAQAGGTVTIDGEQKTVLSHSCMGNQGDGNFILYLYLSEDKKEYVVFEANKDLHVGTDVDLTKREEKHSNQFYLGIGYVNNNGNVFYTLSNPTGYFVVFTTGMLRIDGDPTGLFIVNLTNGTVTDAEHGDGQTHTLSINYTSGETADYGIKVCGVPVTPANANDLTTIEGVTGTASYDPSSNTIILNNANINTVQNVIEIEKEGTTNEEYNILLVGDNTLTSRNGHGLRFVGVNLNIKGSGSLTVNSDNYIALCIARGKTAVVGGCTVTMKGKQGVNGWKTAGMSIVNSEFTAIATGSESSDNAMFDLTSLTLTGCKITQPARAAFDASLKGVALDGTLVKDKVVIEETKKYPVFISTEQLNENDDLTDIKRDAIKSGKVSYDLETRTLTLENAVIEPKNGNAIFFSDADPSLNYTLVLKGNENKLSQKIAPLASSCTLTITGDGSAKMISKEDCGIFVNYNSTLTITGGCTITAEGKWGISGVFGSETLIIDGANVNAKGTDGSICDFNEIQLNNCELTAPADATIEGGNVMLNGEKCTEEVVIRSTVNGIETAIVTTASAKRGTYTISGVKTNSDFDKLPKGIYIVDGVVKVKK